VMPGRRNESVMLNTWHELPPVFADEQTADQALAFWDRVIEVRDCVNKELEALRVAGGIGAGLDAEVDLYCGREILETLEKLEDELRFVLITSDARLHIADTPPPEGQHYILSTNDEIWVAVAPSSHPKCIRCWHHRPDVGSHPDHPELCGRCVENVAGKGETRKHA